MVIKADDSKWLCYPLRLHVGNCATKAADREGVRYPEMHWMVPKCTYIKMMPPKIVEDAEKR